MSAEARHPLLVGLFDVLPEAGTAWPARERLKWFMAAEAIFALIYAGESIEPPEEAEADEEPDKEPVRRNQSSPEATDALGENETPTRREILTAMRQGATRLKDIVAKTDLSYQSVSSSLNNMIGNQMVRRVSPGRYEIIVAP